MKTPYRNFKKAHYHGRVARRKPYISAVNKEQRLTVEK